jgi:hypothetical protein
MSRLVLASLALMVTATAAFPQGWRYEQLASQPFANGFLSKDAIAALEDDTVAYSASPGNPAASVWASIIPQRRGCRRGRCLYRHVRGERGDAYANGNKRDASEKQVFHCAPDTARMFVPNLGRTLAVRRRDRSGADSP